jgi:hypothetical protein
LPLPRQIDLRKDCARVVLQEPPGSRVVPSRSRIEVTSPTSRVGSA